MSFLQKNASVPTVLLAIPEPTDCSWVSEDGLVNFIQCSNNFGDDPIKITNKKSKTNKHFKFT